MKAGFEFASCPPPLLRRRGLASQSLSLAINVAFWSWAWTYAPEPDDTVLVSEVAIAALPAVEEPELPEPEPEPEPPPPPEPVEAPPVPQAQVPRPPPKPAPKIELAVPTGSLDGDLAEADTAASGQVATVGTDVEKPAAPSVATRSTAPPKPVANPVKKKVRRKPIERPKQATVPIPLPSNPKPIFPKKLEASGIDGKYVVKLHVDETGKVRGMKVLEKTNSAGTTPAQAAAHKAFLSEIVRVVKQWKFTPAQMEGKTFATWLTITIPFKFVS